MVIQDNKNMATKSKKELNKHYPKPPSHEGALHDFDEISSDIPVNNKDNFEGPEQQDTHPRESWKEVPEVSDMCHLFISSYGRIKMLPKTTRNKHGRKFIYIDGIFYPVDVLVAALFKSNPTGSELTIHLDGDNTNDAVSNLRWVKNGCVDYPVITTGNIIQKAYVHQMKPISMNKMIQTEIKNQFFSTLAPLLPYVAPSQSMLLWNGMVSSMNPDLIKEFLEHYPYADRYADDNLGTHATDQEYKDGSMLVNMEGMVYKLTPEAYHQA